jgi:NADH-quinone oxidoreductase subunit C
MEKTQLKETLIKLLPSAEMKETRQYLELEIPPQELHDAASTLKNTGDLYFDYLICMTGIDLADGFLVVYHLESTLHHHGLVLKIKIPGHEDPVADTISDIWPAGEFHEREIYDLLGVKFNHHPDLRRLFLDDDWGFPLRKDYRDDINIIER